MANLDDETVEPSGKGKPTPKRKEQEARKRRPLVQDRKVGKAAARERDRVKRAKEYTAMQEGDVRNMPPQHAGLPRAFARDYIDARRSIGEFLLPLALLSMGAYFFAGAFPLVATFAFLILVFFMLAWVVETIYLVRRIRTLATAKFGASALPRGYRLYAITRLSQMRSLRLPKPRVKRGEYPV